jgi:hypothetical protein
MAKPYNASIPQTNININEIKPLTTLITLQIQYVQPLEALTINLEVQHPKWLDHLAVLWEANFEASKC